MQDKLASYYEPVKLPDFKASVPATPLPLALEQAANWAEAQQAVPEVARAALRKNAFAVLDTGRTDRVEAFYDDLKNRNLPIFITSDSLLHLYHVQFDETLRQVEETKFFDELLRLTSALREESDKRYSLANVLVEARTAADAKDVERASKAAHLTLSYFSVAARLFDDKASVRDEVAKNVQAELALIEKHAGFAESPLFKYKEDYSQYVPRGHYTRSDKLKRYFKAMMWYGRMGFLIKGKTPQTPDALISEEEAKIQTLAAFQIEEMLGRIKIQFTGPPGYKPEAWMEPARGVWQRIYAVTAYYVGFADDLTPGDYMAAYESMPMRESMLPAGVVEVRWPELQRKLAALRPPEIYSGAGNQSAGPAGVATEADLNKALSATMGMRFMGQRFVPDSYIMGRLVYPSVGRFTGQGAPFTLVQSAGGPIRGFPRGLDVMAVISARAGDFTFPESMETRDSVIRRSRACNVIHQLGDDAYEKYYDELLKLRKQFFLLPEKDWNRNMYWSWLHSLRALVLPAPEGFPTFMRSDTWTDKQLNAALGSWAQLRHDTILYAKQSGTMMATSMPPPPKMVEGYVEPVPEFYAQLLALTRMSLKGLDDLKALDDISRARLRDLDIILSRLLDISVRELQNRRLTPDDYRFIRSFGAQLKSVVAGASSEGLETTIIADVHTDANSRQVLEEGTGLLRTMAVACPMPDGGTVLAFGPVFSYYEFKQPLSDRLTDEAWKKMLRGPNAPKAMGW